MITGIYFSNWSVYGRKHSLVDINWSHVTHIFFAFLKIDGAGTVLFLDPWCDLDMPLPAAAAAAAVNGTNSTTTKGLMGQIRLLKHHHPQVKVMCSIGGWGTNASFEALVTDSAKAGRFVESTAKLVREYNFDGVDLDWEYPNSRQQGQFLTTLVVALRRALPSALLSIAAPANLDNINQLDMTIDRELDFWNVMTYDFCGGWSHKAGFHSNLLGDNGDNNLNGHKVISYYVQKGIPSHKLVLGMPAYGRTFVGAKRIGSRFNSSETIDYKNLPLPGTTPIYDDKRVATSCTDGKQLVVYDDPRSVAVKAKYIRSQGLGGGFFWDSAGDTNSAGDARGNQTLLSTLHHHLHSSHGP